jgi:hypothetical protein
MQQNMAGNYNTNQTSIIPISIANTSNRNNQLMNGSLERSSSTTTTNNKLHRKTSINQPSPVRSIEGSGSTAAAAAASIRDQKIIMDHHHHQQQHQQQQQQQHNYHSRNINNETAHNPSPATTSIAPPPGTGTTTSNGMTTNNNEPISNNPPPPPLRQSVARPNRPLTAHSATLPSHHSSSRLPLLPTAKVEASPAACMYLSKASIHGPKLIKPLRAHTSTLVNDAIWIFGGTDLTGCFKDVWKLDLETLSFTKMKCKGSEDDDEDDQNDVQQQHQINSLDDPHHNPHLSTRAASNNHRLHQPARKIRSHPKDHIPPPCRAHSATHLDGRIFIFGGGDGPNYFDVLYYLDTSKSLRFFNKQSTRYSYCFLFLIIIPVSLTWTKPKVKGILPSTRRAHATVLYGTQLIIFGGGNGSRALNDVHALDLSDLTNLEWRELAIKGRSPLNRGYHSANLVGSKCIIFGGSDGGECFSDIFILDLGLFFTVSFFL